MNVQDAFPSRFITSADVDKSQSPIKLRIRSVDLERIGRGRSAEKKLVLAFYGTPKQLVLNVANRSFMVKQLGPETDNWHGREITISCVDATYEGEIVRSVRVRDILPPLLGDVAARQPQRPVELQHSDEEKESLRKMFTPAEEPAWKASMDAQIGKRNGSVRFSEFEPYKVQTQAEAKEIFAAYPEVHSCEDPGGVLFTRGAVII